MRQGDASWLSGLRLVTHPPQNTLASAGAARYECADMWLIARNFTHLSAAEMAYKLAFRWWQVAGCRLLYRDTLPIWLVVVSGVVAVVKRDFTVPLNRFW